MKLARTIGTSVAVLWASLWLLFALGRWGCFPWYAERCALGFWTRFESAVLFLWVKDPETLVSAFLAMGAAGVGAYYLSRQIRSSEQLEAERRAREHRASRAMLPLTLSEICEFSQECAAAWIRMRTHSQRLADNPGVTIEPLEMSFPRPSPNVISDLRTFIRDATQPEVIHFTALIREIQVRIARGRDGLVDANDVGQGVADFYVASELIEVAQLYARASTLFDFAREEGPLPKYEVERAPVRTALFAFGFSEITEPDVFSFLEAYHPI